jgi:tRNA pseudouridine55 synthase
VDNRRSTESVDGLLPIHKPLGMVSKDVSRWLVRRFGRLKLGHVGTLDPGASGVLPILLGRATRLQDFMLDLSKSYEFDMKLGFETDSLDLDGVKVRECPWEHVTAPDLAAAGSNFLGEIEQIPPIYSAVKYRGKALYDYARGGSGESVPVESLKRRVTIHNLDFLGYQEGTGTFRVSCSKGTYIRTLVKDIAEKVGSCATLTRLVRTEAAGLKLEETVTLDEVESRQSQFADLIIPLNQVKVALPRWQSDSSTLASRLWAGQEVVLESCDYESGIRWGHGTGHKEADTLLLLDSMGNAFGIGAKKTNMAGQIVIQMKRGL